MKRTIVIITALLFALNLLAGLIFSGFKPFNVAYSSVVILITGVLLFLLYRVGLKDAFAISLSFLFLILGLAEYILGLSSPARFQNNTVLFATVILLFLEVIIFTIVYITSKKQ